MRPAIAVGKDCWVQMIPRLRQGTGTADQVVDPLVIALMVYYAPEDQEVDRPSLLAAWDRWEAEVDWGHIPAARACAVAGLADRQREKRVHWMVGVDRRKIAVRLGADSGFLGVRLVDWLDTDRTWVGQVEAGPASVVRGREQEVESDLAQHSIAKPNVEAGDVLDLAEAANAGILEKRVLEI